MEERQIQEFVHWVYADESLRKELASDPEAVIKREQCSPAVARVIARLVPHLTLDRPVTPVAYWWHP